MRALLRRRGWRRRRKGVHSIEFFEHNEPEGLQEVDVLLLDWGVSRAQDPATGADVLAVTLSEVQALSRANLQKIGWVRIDGLFYAVHGIRDPLSRDSDGDWMLLCDPAGNEKGPENG